MTSDNPIRWGILGAAKFAREHMAPAIHLAEGAVLKALATSSPEKAEPFVRLAPGLAVFDDYDALLASPDIDAVYSPLPNHMHVEWTLKALAAGKAVLTEKPIAMEESDFKALIAARDEAGLLAAEAYMILHHPQWTKVKRLISEGAIGTLHHVSGVFTYNNSDKPENIRNRAETGGGGLRDIGVYPFGATRFVLDAEPETVLADITWENGVDTIARVRAMFGAVSMDTLISMRMHLSQGMTFYGSQGRIVVAAPFNPVSYGEAVVTLHSDEPTRVWRFGSALQYVNQVEAFGQSMRGQGKYPVPLEFSQGTQRMIDLALKSAGPPAIGD